MNISSEGKEHGPKCAQRVHGAAECDCGVADRNDKPKLTLSRCTYCKGFNVFVDAYVGINNGEQRTYQQEFCSDCEGECSTEEVTMVAADTVAPMLEKLANYARDSTLENDPVPQFVKDAEKWIKENA